MVGDWTVSGFKTGSFRVVEKGGSASVMLEGLARGVCVGASCCKLQVGVFDGNADGSTAENPHS